MIDKKLETNIKKTKEFVELWRKFRGIFANTISGSRLGDDEEKEFISTRNLVNSRYEDLMDSLGIKPLGRFLKSPSVYDVLSVERLSTMSDDRLEKVDEDWKKSSKYLAMLLERLMRKKRRLEGFNKFFFLTKKGISKLR